MSITSLSASVNEGKRVEAVRIITDAARKAVTAAIDKLAEAKVFDDSTFQKQVVESSYFAVDMQNSLQSVIESQLVTATRSWREKDGVIYFTLVSDGTTGQQWTEIFPDSPKWTKDVLLSPHFRPTKGVVYRVAVLKGTLFSDENRITKKIRKDAAGRNLGTPNAELGCLIRKNFSNEDIEAMGLWWIVAMHDPIEDSAGAPVLLCAYRLCGARGLCAASGSAGWRAVSGFAFVLPQDQSLVSDTKS